MDTLVLDAASAPSRIHFGAWAELAAELERATAGLATLTVTDRNVAAALPGLVPSGALVLEPGEAHKNFAALETILDAAVAAGCDRSSKFIAVGGGVVGDLTGFAAAVFMRGIPVIQIPTTLLAMVDSSVGGKTGLDLKGGKNLAGAFLQPETVLIAPETLRTLPAAERGNGLGEIVKYGMILDPALFARLEAGLPGDDPAVIRRCCALKAEVVSGDEREAGNRAILNYGHTFGHAVELLSRFAIPHGAGVAIGMRAAAECAVLAGLLDRASADRQNRLLQKLGLPTAIPREFTVPELIGAMRHDKKSRQGNLHLVLPRAVGRVEIRSDIPEQTVAAALEASR